MSSRQNNIAARKAILAQPRRAGRGVLVTIVGWSTTIAMIFPLLWMVFVSFKTEVDAVDSRHLFTFHMTFSAYRDVLQRSPYWHFAANSLVEALCATLCALMLAAPAAYALAFYPTARSHGLLLWMLSTKMMPAVGALVPIYMIGRSTGMLDTRFGLVILFTVTNLPIIVWVLYNFFREIPMEIMESGRMDGASLLDEFRYLLMPLSLPGLASTGLLSIILCWNETFWSLNLTAARAAPLTQFVISFATPKALFLSKLSAASVLSILPVLVLGWISQKQLLRGFGAARR